MHSIALKLNQMPLINWIRNWSVSIELFMQWNEFIGLLYSFVLVPLNEADISMDDRHEEAGERVLRH